MLLEFFFQERFMNSDYFFDNPAILINNVVTLIFITGLAMTSFDFYMQKRKTGDQLFANNLYTIVSAFCLLVASSIRLVVNSSPKTVFSASFDENGVSECNSFSFRHIFEFGITDVIYLICTVFPICWFHFSSICFICLQGGFAKMSRECSKIAKND